MRLSCTPEQLAEYKNNGVICLRNAFDQEWLNKLSGDIDTILRDPRGRTADQSIPTEKGRFFNGFFQWLNNDGIKDFVLNSPAHQIAAFVMESKSVRFFYDQLLVKEPGTSQRTPWHTDADYFPIKGKKITSIWVPLEPVTKENGTLQFIKGSHLCSVEDLLSKIPENKKSRDHEKGMYVLPDFDDYPEAFEFLSWDLKPGDCLIFHIDIVHLGHDNPSGKRRRALSTRWFGEGCHVDETRPHILNKPNISNFIESNGFKWDGRIENPLFPKFSV